VFDGQYVTGDVDQSYLDQLATARSEKNKGGVFLSEEDDESIDLHNDEST
jgi:amidophosphoribosyltransferase